MRGIECACLFCEVLIMRDYKNMRYVDPEPVLPKIVYSTTFTVVLLALIIGACL